MRKRWNRWRQGVISRITVEHRITRGARLSHSGRVVTEVYPTIVLRERCDL